MCPGRSKLVDAIRKLNTVETGRLNPSDSPSQFMNSEGVVRDRAMARITGLYLGDLDPLTEGAVALYERERITLGDAARLADVDRWTMRDILREHGVELRLGLVDEDDAAYEVEAANELEFDDEDSDDVDSPAK